MIHDVEYLRWAGAPDRIALSDLAAIKNADWDLPGLATKLGLELRLITGIPFDSGNTSDQKLGEFLQLYIARDKFWQHVFRQYNLAWTDMSQFPDPTLSTSFEIV